MLPRVTTAPTRPSIDEHSVPRPGAPRARHDAVDFLRGAVMVLMALDHARDFFAGFREGLTDPATTTPALFFTRWVTHFCAPVFVLLAGTGAFLSKSGGRSTASLSRFLWTRGLWLVLLEMTVVRLGWLFDLTYAFSILQVIWAIGWSMVVLAALVYLPVAAIGALGVAMMLTHDLLDGVGATWGLLWDVLHQPAMLEWMPQHQVRIAYPLIPWVGVMAAGYAFGAMLTRPPDEKRRLLLRLGLSLITAFVVIRAVNHYGDPHPWSPQRSPLYTLLSFLNCEKYPPSLDYLLMTLGPALVVLFPGESYVEYQRLAQSLRPDRFVVALGYGESATGYVPTARAVKEHDSNLQDWCWVAPGAETALTRALKTLLDRPE